ncbi:MAG: hypothetical protein J6Y43_07285 [Clostridia bacterium]|nr:hypothetical protein [Clostridia bacterium]
MIDIHSHILNNVDDGSRNSEQSLAMLKEEEKQGVTEVVLTPHYRADYLPKSDDIRLKFAELKKRAKENGINVKLRLGQEIFVFDGIVKALESGKVLSVDGGKYVLVEFSTKHVNDIPETVYMLVKNGYIPIVAHIGRYFYADTETAREVKDIGGLIQINASSVCGSFAYKRKALALIKAGLVEFVASDVHYNRKNLMLKAYKKVERKFGKATADKLFTENARAMLYQ